MSPGKSRSKNEGGIRLRSKSARISDSNFAGRDYIEGIPVKNLNQIIKTLLNHFPEHYLQDPDKLDKTLNELHTCREELLEYKDLHNKIHEILVAFEPFKLLINSLQYYTPELERLQTRWYPVEITIQHLLDWAQTIKHIGKRFQILGDNRREGESWAVQYSVARDRFNRLGLSVTARENMEYRNRKQIYSFQRTMNEVSSLEKLPEYTSQFNDLTLLEMKRADDELRKTAQRLVNISHQALSNH